MSLSGLAKKQCFATGRASDARRIVGAAVVANDASGLLQQMVNAIQTKTLLSELNEIIYAHPTTSEAMSEAILNLEDKALFVPPKKV